MSDDKDGRRGFFRRLRSKYNGSPHLRVNLRAESDPNRPSTVGEREPQSPPTSPPALALRSRATAPLAAASSSAAIPPSVHKPGTWPQSKVDQAAADVQKMLVKLGRCIPTDRWIVVDKKIYELHWNLPAPAERDELLCAWVNHQEAQAKKAGHGLNPQEFEQSKAQEADRLLQHHPDFWIRPEEARSNVSDTILQNFLQSHPADGFHIVGKQVYNAHHRALQQNDLVARKLNAQRLKTKLGFRDSRIETLARAYNAWLTGGPAPEATAGVQWLGTLLRHTGKQLAEEAKATDSFLIDRRHGLVFQLSHDTHKERLNWRPDVSLFEAAQSNFFNISPWNGYEILYSTIVHEAPELFQEEGTWVQGRASSRISAGEARKRNIKMWLRDLLEIMTKLEYNLEHGRRFFYDGFVVAVSTDQDGKPMLALTDEPQTEYSDLIEHVDPRRDYDVHRAKPGPWATVPRESYEHIVSSMMKHWECGGVPEPDEAFTMELKEGYFEGVRLLGSEGLDMLDFIFARNDSGYFAKDGAEPRKPKDRQTPLIA